MKSSALSKKTTYLFELNSSEQEQLAKELESFSKELTATIKGVKMSTNVISAGSTFVQSSITTIMGSMSGQSINDELERACEKIKEVLDSTGSIDLPRIVQELKIPIDIAIKAINKLRQLGYVKFENEL